MSKTLFIWLNYLLRSAIGRRRFIGVTPPWFQKQRLYDRFSGRWLQLNIRDNDDWVQVEHIFLNEEFNLEPTNRTREIRDWYNKLIATGKTPLIIDLGANIGLATRYFHESYPAAHLISVEPDPSNCAVARKNLPPNATLIEAAISSRSGRGDLINTGRNCGFRVEKSDDESKEGNVNLTTVSSLLEKAGNTIPFIIKIDIEGYEEDLFSASTEWIDRFPVLLIELHDWMLPKQHVTRRFLSEMAAREREFMHFDGYVVSLGAL